MPVHNQLYEFSSLQKTVSIILLALVDGRPRVMPVKEMMQEFLKHRIAVIRRRTEFLLREAKRRGHILEGQLFAISSLDEVIQICRTSPSRQETKVRLQNLKVAAAVLERAIGDEAFAAFQRELGVAETYQMTEVQSEAIVRMQLGQLAALERDEIYKEFSHLRGQIHEHETLLGSDTNIQEVIRKDLEYIYNRFGDDRKTEISDAGSDVNLEDLIPEHDQVVTLTHNGYVKRLPLNTFRAQHRGGRGVSGGTKDDDFVEHFFIASTHAYLLCFTNQGQCYWLRVFNIPEASRTSAGRSIANVLSLKAEERISSVIPVRSFEGDFHLLMATRKGLVKKTALEEYDRPRQGGIIGINLREEDSLISVALTKPGDEVVLSTRNGMAIRFSQRDARSIGRNTSGVRGINLRPEDELVGMVVADPTGFLLTVCENGYGKRTPFGPNTVGDLPEIEETAETAVEETSEPVAVEAEAEGEGEAEESTEKGTRRYRLQRRGGKGVRDIQTSARNGKVVGIVAVSEQDDIMLITQQGMVNRTHVSEIGVKGRNTQGVRVMNLNEGDRIASLAKLAREEVIETPGETPTETPAPPSEDVPPPTPATEPTT